MNRHQKAIYKCAKKCYKAIKKNAGDSETRTWGEFYSLFKWSRRHDTLEELNGENIYYRWCCNKNVELK